MSTSWCPWFFHSHRNWWHRNRWLAVAACSFITLVTVVFVTIFWMQRRKSLIPINVAIAMPRSPISALILLAHQLGYLSEQGLRLKMFPVTTGHEALELMSSGQVNYSVVSVPGVIKAYLAGQKVRILTELHSSTKNSLLLVKDAKKVERERDLRGRKIGVVAGTFFDFRINLLLNTDGLSREDVKIIFGTLDETIQRFEKDEVDAVILWQPYASQIMANPQNQTKVFDFPGYTEFSVLLRLGGGEVGGSDAVGSEKATNEALLRALKMAYEFYLSNQSSAQSFLDSSMGWSDHYDIQSIWQNLDIHLGLSEVLVTMLNEEVAWALRGEKSLRNSDQKMALEDLQLEELLDPTPLERVLPELITYK